IDKTVKASFVHIEAIEKIKTKKGLDYLKPDLMSIAKLRVDNPEASLSELAALSGLSRSGVNHRLAKLVEISKEL
ncbi:MAG: DNA-binding protein WhiA, partial [Eubacterium sp.]|nr:DNA-binding protein WhiA [Eubacterium sp.]